MIKREKMELKKREEKNSEGEVKEKEEKGKEEAPRGFFNRFNNKIVILKLTSGDSLIGRLVTNSYNKYDCLLKTPGKSEVLIPKHSIIFIAIKSEEKEKNIH